jgi:hypothetical protein
MTTCTENRPELIKLSKTIFKTYKIRYTSCIMHNDFPLQSHYVIYIQVSLVYSIPHFILDEAQENESRELTCGQ